MAPGGFRFERFVLDPHDRQLRLNGAPVELNGRYLDALALLVREQGRLVSKDRFLEEVWRGVPVTDEALTQCIRTLRRQLGDSAVSPRFIETVPKHGYRFIAPVEAFDPDARSAPAPASPSVGAPPAVAAWRLPLLGGAAMLGGGGAGVVGGLFYGLVGASQPPEAGMGAMSIILVLMFITAMVGVMGGAGVGLGIAAADPVSDRPWWWSLIGGAAGGLVVGAVVKLVGLDAFNLLFGRSPGEITGAAEGALLGGAIGFGAWLGRRAAGPRSLARSMAVAGLVSGAAGVLVVLIGGRLMGGSLDQLARRFPESRLRLDQIGGLFGEPGFGPISQAVTGGLEGMLFGACVVGAMILARRKLDGDAGRPG